MREVHWICSHSYHPFTPGIGMCFLCSQIALDLTHLEWIVIRSDGPLTTTPLVKDVSKKAVKKRGTKTTTSFFLPFRFSKTVSSLDFTSN